MVVLEPRCPKKTLTRVGPPQTKLSGSAHEVGLAVRYFQEKVRISRSTITIEGKSRATKSK